MQRLHKNLTLLFMAATLSLFYISCQKEIKGTDVITTPADDATKTTASVQGYVINENSLPVSGAVVASGSVTATTDAKGYFAFSNIQLSKNNGYVKVTMPGYFTGSRSFFTSTGRVNNVRIQLLPKTNVGTIDATAGGSVTFASGISITLPAGSVVNASTNVAYSGTVKVAAAWIDPTSNSLTDQMPGDLRGITTSGSESGLQSFGMVGAELTGSSGELLQIATGKKATINFTIPAAIASFAPATIDLWHFDETAGRWMQEGSATKSGNVYIAAVSHFSFWNCDAQFPLVTFSATFVSATGAPLVNAQVRIKRVVNNAFGYGITDSVGYVSGKIPSNEALVLEVLDQCGASVFSQNIGPFTANVNLGTLTVTGSTTSFLNISGTLVDCSSAPVTNGYVEIHLGYHFYRVPVSANGSFGFMVTNCSSTTSLDVIGVDNATNQQSTTQTISISGTAVVIPAIQACGTSSLQTITYTVDGTTYNLTSPPDSIYSSGSGTSNGTYITGYTVPATTNHITFSYSLTAPAVGSYPLTYLTVGQVDSSTINTPSPVVNITQYGALGQFIVGNFTVQLKKLTDNTLHPVTCNFRIRRR